MKRRFDEKTMVDGARCKCYCTKIDRKTLKCLSCGRDWDNTWQKNFPVLLRKKYKKVKIVK